MGVGGGKAEASGPGSFFFQGWRLPRRVFGSLVTGILAPCMQALLCPTWSPATQSLLFSAVAFSSPTSNTSLQGPGKPGCFPVSAGATRDSGCAGPLLGKSILTAPPFL